MDREETPEQIRQRQGQRWDRALFIAILAVVGGGILVIAAQEHLSRPGRRISPRNVCIMNLRMLDGAKQTWALENKRATNDVPVDSDLFGPALYVSAKPQCPSGGRYSLRAIGRKPCCSIVGHTF